MVFAQKTNPGKGAPFRCYHLSTPTASQITFDDRRLVNNAGLLLPATLALNLGLRQLVDHHLDLGDAPGRGERGGQTADRWSLPRWRAATASTTPMRCAPVERSVFQAAQSRRHPHWALSCAASAGATSASWTG